MAERIKYTRIKNTVRKMTDLNVSSDLPPIIEDFLIDKLFELLDKADDMREASGRITLYIKDLKLNIRYLKLGKVRTLARSEIRELILERIGREKHIQTGVIETLRGFLIEELRVMILKINKLAKHSNHKTLKADHFKFYYRKRQ